MVGSTSCLNKKHRQDGAKMKKLFLIFFGFSIFSNSCKSGPNDLTPKQIENFIEFIDLNGGLNAAIELFLGIQPSEDQNSLKIEDEALSFQLTHHKLPNNEESRQWIKLANVGTLFQIFNYLMTDALIPNPSFDRQVQEPRNQILENASVFTFCYLILAMVIVNRTALSGDFNDKKNEFFEKINMLFEQNENFKNFMEYLCNFFRNSINLGPYPQHLLSKTILIIFSNQKEIFPFRTLDRYLGEKLRILANETFNASCQKLFKQESKSDNLSQTSTSPSNYSSSGYPSSEGGSLTDETISENDKTPQKTTFALKTRKGNIAILDFRNI